MGSRMVRRLVFLATAGLALLALCSPAWAQTFTKGTEVPVDIHTPDVEAADINGDGHLDAAVGASAGTIGSQHVRILAGDGAGGFAQIGDFAPPDTNLSGLAMGDMNGDGRPDLVYSGNSNTSASVRVALGDGTGAFTQRATAPVGTNPTTAVLADLDGDGDLDVVVGSAWAGSSTQPTSGTVTVIPNNGDGTLGSRALYTVGNTPGGISFGDVDGDNDLDMAVARFGSDVALLTNNGSGGFSVRPAATGNPDTSDVVLADLDDDGYADLASVNPNNSGGLGVALNDGTGGFGAPAVRPLANTYGLRTADLDGDGDRDLAAVRSAQSPGAILVYSNDGAGAFSLKTTVTPNPTSSIFGDLAVGDVKEDGRPDMLALRGNPSGSLIPLISNEPPVISSVEVTPARPGTDETVGATVSASDPNGDGITTSYRWQKQGPQDTGFSDIANETNASLDLSKNGNGDLGDTVRVIATAKDTANLASSRTSNEVQIIDPAPQITLNTSNLDFGARSVGSIGSARTLTVTNTGGREPLNVGAVRRSGANPGDFVVADDGCSGEAVPAGGSCQVGLRFAPEAAGSRTATLGISSDAAGGPAVAALSGTGRLVAQNDSYVTGGDETLTVQAPGVLENDTEELPLKALRVDGPGDGALSLEEDGSFEYVPDAGFDGTDSFTYQAADGTGAEANRSNEARVTILVRPAEGIAPETKLLDAPGATSNSPSAAFSFSSPEPGATFECSLDEADFTACESPKEYADLDEGPHVFRVRAVDAAGNVDQSPATRSWEVDTTAPKVEGVSPKNGARAVSRGTDVAVFFSEAMDEASVVRADALTLRERGAVKFVPATRSYDPATNSLTLDPSRALKPGATYVARVRFLATDEAGNDLREITAWSFTVKR